MKERKVGYKTLGEMLRNCLHVERLAGDVAITVSPELEPHNRAWRFDGERHAEKLLTKFVADAVYLAKREAKR